MSIVLMAIFMIGGSIGLASKWPAGPAGLDWGVWIVVYGGYVFLISAAAFHVKTGK